MKNIAIFASGEGSNAEAIAQYFANNDKVCVKCVLTNRQNAGVNQRMEKLGIDTHFFPKESWSNAHEIVDFLQKENIHFIILAGFLAKIEPPIIHSYNHHIINIHPSLLPRYGGKGMWASTSGSSTGCPLVTTGKVLIGYSSRRTESKCPTLHHTLRSRTPLPGTIRKRKQTSSSRQVLSTASGTLPPHC